MTGSPSHSFDRLSFGYDRHRGVNKVTAMSKPVVSPMRFLLLPAKGVASPERLSTATSTTPRRVKTGKPPHHAAAPRIALYPSGQWYSTMAGGWIIPSDRHLVAARRNYITGRVINECIVLVVLSHGYRQKFPCCQPEAKRVQNGAQTEGNSVENPAEAELPNIKREPWWPDQPRFGQLYFAAEELTRKIEHELALAGPRGRRSELWSGRRWQRGG